MSKFEFTSLSEADTDRLGQLIAEAAEPGDVLALVGTLGAGKTRLVQGIAVALGNTADSITSPTFVLVNEYQAGRLPVYHFDVYRLADEDEFISLGPEEYFDGDGITLVEWGDRVQAVLPRRATVVSIDLDRFDNGSQRDQRSIVVEGPLAERLAAAAK